MNVKPRILVVDDDPVARHILQSILSAGNFEPVITSSGKEAFAFMERAQQQCTLPKAVLVDLQLEDMSGVAMVKTWRGSPELKHIPLIMLSANSEAEVRKDAPGLSIDAFLEKPFTTEDVLETLARILLR